MILYSDTSKQFIIDNIQNQISQKLKNRFFTHFGYNLPMVKSDHGKTL